MQLLTVWPVPSSMTPKSSLNITAEQQASALHKSTALASHEQPAPCTARLAGSMGLLHARPHSLILPCLELSTSTPGLAGAGSGEPAAAPAASASTPASLQPGSAPSLFGASSSAAFKPQPGTGLPPLFGASQGTNSLFGAPQSQPASSAPSLFGNLGNGKFSFGAPAPPASSGPAALAGPCPPPICSSSDACACACDLIAPHMTCSDRACS